MICRFHVDLQGSSWGPLLGENVLEARGTGYFVGDLQGEKVSIQEKWALEIPVEHF